MIIDKPKTKKTNKLKLNDSEVNQIEVFNDLINDSVQYIKTIKKVFKPSLNQEIEIVKVKVKKNVEDYNKFRKAKKQYIKSLITKGK